VSRVAKPKSETDAFLRQEPTNYFQSPQDYAQAFSDELAIQTQTKEEPMSSVEILTQGDNSNISQDAPKAKAAPREVKLAPFTYVNVEFIVANTSGFDAALFAEALQEFAKEHHAVGIMLSDLKVSQAILQKKRGPRAQ
jgi:hypothetical protein